MAHQGEWVQQGGKEAEGRSGRHSGSHLPDTHTLLQEMFRIRDLDAGKEYSLDQVKYQAAEVALALRWHWRYVAGALLGHRPCWHCSGWHWNKAMDRPFHQLALQRYWIKDMDTGTVYVLEGDEGGGGSGPGGAPGAGGEGSGRVTELLSGRELRCGGGCVCTYLCGCL